MPAVSHIDQELENKILSHLKTAVSIETRSEQRTFQNRSDQSLRFLNSAYDHYANALANERQQDPVTVDILEDYASINLDDLTQDLQKDISNTQDSLECFRTTEVYDRKRQALDDLREANRQFHLQQQMESKRL